MNIEARKWLDELKKQQGAGRPKKVRKSVYVSAEIYAEFAALCGKGGVSPMLERLMAEFLMAHHHEDEPEKPKKG